MMEHDIKINPFAYEAVVKGDKNFEIRYNDRGYQRGDILTMRAFDRGNYDTSKDPIYAVVTYVSTYEQKEGWCVLGIRTQ